MEGMAFLLIGLAVAFNMIIIKIKLERKRYEDALLDGLCLAVVTIVFSGSYAGLVVGTIASAVISLYLLASPPTFFRKLDVTNRIKKEIRELNL